MAKYGNQNCYGGARSIEFCRELFGKLKIPHFQSQNLISLLFSVVEKKITTN